MEIPLLVTDIDVYATDLNDAAWRYFIKYCGLGIWFMLFDCLVGSTWGV